MIFPSPLIAALLSKIDCATILWELEYTFIGDFRIRSHEKWTTVHDTVKIGGIYLPEAVFKRAGLEKDVRSSSRKIVEIVVVRAGIWCGSGKTLIWKCAVVRWSGRRALASLDM